MKNTIGIFLLTSVSVAGCGTAAESGLDDSQASLATAKANCSPDDKVTLTAWTRDYPGNAPVVGTQICALRIGDGEKAECGPTGADGSVNLTIHDCGDVRVTYALAGFLSANQLLRIRGNTLTGSRMITNDQGRRIAGAVGATFDPAMAQPIFTAYDAVTHQAIGGVATKLLPANGVNWYLSASGIPMTSMTSMSAAGISGVANVAPGTYDVVGTPPPGKSCSIEPYVPGDSPNSIKMEALPGSIGEARYLCN